MKIKKVIDMIRPPYSAEFVALFMPLVEEFRSDEEKSYQEFINYCKETNSSN
jgi:hypothetical protein